MDLITVGVLALQGCVEPHRYHLESLGARYKEVRASEDFEEIHGLILPGGESTTMIKLIQKFQLEEQIRDAFRKIPVWGICAGAILLAKNVEAPSQWSFGFLDMTVQRNGYGRQRDSFNMTVEGDPVSFIRAPLIKSVGPAVKVESKISGHPVWVRSDRCIATTFHPELYREKPSSFHRHFIELTRT